MKKLQFNFNNEVDVFEIQQDEDGRIIVPGPDGVTPIATYETLQQFAEIYAQARDVKPENLKNWVLVENGEVVSFVLRAGTAGVSVGDIRTQLDEVLNDIREEGVFHPLNVERIRQELVSDDDDIMVKLATSSVMDVAREVYDRLNGIGAFTEQGETVADEPVEVDNRSDMEKYLDSVMEQDKTLAAFAQMLNLDVTDSKEEVLAAIETSRIPYTVAMCRDIYESALSSIREGMNVDSRFDAILVLTQSVPMEPDVEVKTKLVTVANMARREKLSVSVYEVGNRHIRKNNQLMTIMELNEQDIYMINNVAVVVIFNPEVDAQLEAEAAAEAAAAETENVNEDTNEDFDEDYDEDFNEDSINY